MKKAISKVLSLLGILMTLTLIIGCGKNTTQKTSKVTTQSTTKQESKQITKVLTKKKFFNLKVISQNADVIVETGKSYKVTYQGKNTTVPVIKTSKDKLVIDQVKAQHSLGIMRIPRLVITIPKKIKLNKLEVKNGSSDTRINNVSLKKAIVSSDKGDIIVSNSKSVNGMNLKSVTGNVKLSNTAFSGYKLKTSDGQIQFKNHSADTSYVKNAKSKNVLVAESGSKEIWVK